MEISKTSNVVIYLLLLFCAAVYKISGDTAVGDGIDTDDAVNSDILSLLNHNVSPRLQLLLRRRVSDALKSNPDLQKYVPLTNPDQAENQQVRGKRLAGLENLDLMTGIFARMPMRTNAALSDLQERMRQAGRK